MRAQLESLPPEILIEVFDFLSPNDFARYYLQISLNPVFQADSHLTEYCFIYHHIIGQRPELQNVVHYVIQTWQSIHGWSYLVKSGH